MVLTEILSSIRMLAVLTALTGVAYPLLVTAVAQSVFADAANGSLVTLHGRTVGSMLVGQSFGDPRYFWGRPSATAPQPYNGAASSGSNLGARNPALAAAVAARVKALLDADPGNVAAVPVDLVTASASGLDPHISIAAAQYQLARVARLRGLAPETVRGLIAENTQQRTFGILGEARVNVLALNLALDSAAGAK
jgi:potassium-transporting ATPase KdpC subunit